MNTGDIGDGKRLKDPRLPLEWNEIGLTLMALPILTVVNGFVIMKCWEWFVVPYFHQQPLTIAMGVGLRLLLGIAAGVPSSPRKRTAWQLIVENCAASSLTLLFAYCLKSFM